MNDIKAALKGDTKQEFSNAHKLRIEPQNYIKGEWYTLTISPPYFQYTVDAFGSFAEWKKQKRQYDYEIFHKIACFFNDLETSNICKVHLYGEYSPQGRYHFHGKVTILNRVDFVSFILRKLCSWGIVEVDTITDPQIWEDYYKKSHITMIEDGYEDIAYYTNIHDEPEQPEEIKVIKEIFRQEAIQQKAAEFKLPKLEIVDTRPKAKAKKYVPKKVKIDN